MEVEKDLRSRQEVRNCVYAAAKAQAQLCRMDQAAIDRIVEAMSKTGFQNAKMLAELARNETGFGSVPDKTIKNEFASMGVWKAIRDLKTIGILRQDKNKQIWEIGVPVGVIAGIVPSTNPTSTVIYKAMIALKAGNAIVFSPHPGAKNCTMQAVKLLKQAAEEAGCPRDAIMCVSEPTMDAVDELMKHPGVHLILATGGSAMVRSAYRSGKPAIGVGAGNGPSYLHSSCDLKQAVADIIRSKTFDYGTICASEQSVVLERKYAAQFEAEFVRQGCYVLNEQESKKLAGLLFRANGTMNPQIVGKPASEIAHKAGLSAAAQQAKVLIARETGVGKSFAYSMEKLCPVLGLYVTEDTEQALQLVCDILKHEGSGHTCSIHAKDETVIRKFAEQVPVSRFLVNTPASLGGIGSSTELFPALTLGCGAVGGSSSSNNIGPLDLINLRRVAWGTGTPAPVTTVEAKTDDALVDMLTQKLLQKLLKS